jgi:hypothetical protein
VALPDNWNGRFLFQGGGGLNGTLALPLGAQAAGGTPGLARGFAGSGDVDDAKNFVCRRWDHE